MKTKKTKKKASQIFAFITGCKSTKWPPQRTVDKYVRQLAEKGYRDDGFVITGGSRDVEKKVVRACKSNKVRVLVFPANFEMLSGNSAEQLRNDSALRNFKPNEVLIFSHKEIDHDSVLAHLVKLSSKFHTIELTKIIKGA